MTDLYISFTDKDENVDIAKLLKIFKSMYGRQSVLKLTTVLRLTRRGLGQWSGNPSTVRLQVHLKSKPFIISQKRRKLLLISLV